MHREFHAHEMDQLPVLAFGEPSAAAPGESHRTLYVFTAVLGLLIAADVLLGALGLESLRTPWGISLAMVAALLGALRIVYGAVEALAAGRIGADFALAQAAVAALVIGQPFVAAEVVFIAMVGEVLEAVTFARAQRAIHRLLDQTPRTARVRRDGVEIEIPAGQVQIGDLVLIRPGERVPVDGAVISGRSAVDQSALTGESLAVDKGPGERVFTGTVNQFGLLEVQAEKVGHETTFGQVLRLVAGAQKRKAPLERAADRYARYFLPVVETAAGLTLLAGYVFGWPDVWLRTVAVLVVACPCALVLATPAAVLASMAWLARRGVLIKGGVALERLAACDTFAFDKTGTLTQGRPELAAVVPLGSHDEDELLRLAATAERASQHPLAQVVYRAAEARKLRAFEPIEAKALPGVGVSARYRAGSGSDEHTILVGNPRLMAERGVALSELASQALAELDAQGQTPLLIALDDQVIGLLGVRDAVRPEAHDVVHDLKHLKISQIALLTGDRTPAAQAVARKTHIKSVEAELLPAGKALWVQEQQASGRRVAMVGDGINDAPALAQAHVGVAIGGIGADLAAEAGDIVLLGEPLATLPGLVQLSRATVAVIRQNILIFAFGLNATAMTLAAVGILGPVAAAILHQVGSLFVLLNAMRLLAFGDWANLPPQRALRALGATIGRLDQRFDLSPLPRWLWARRQAALGLAVVAALFCYATWALTAIEPDEVGLVRRGGRFVALLPPGLHWRLPPPFERIDRLRPDRLRSVEIGFRTAGSETGALSWESGHGRGVIARREDEALMMTGDGRLVELTAAAQYRLDRRPEALRSYLFGTADPEETLRALLESSVREVISQRRLEDLLTARRPEAERAAAKRLAERTQDIGLGVGIASVAFQEVHPPLAVVDAYRDVSRAGSWKDQRLNEGQTYRAEQLALAEGTASSLKARAEAARASRLALAASEADAFLARQQARSGAPELTDHRLYWEALTSALAGKPKVILDPAHHPRHQFFMTDYPLGGALPVLPTRPKEGSP